MQKLAAVIVLSFVTLAAFGQSTSKYQVATILEIKPHLQHEAQPARTASYDVSAKIGETIYVVLYTPHLGEESAKYAAGSELLVHVGEQTITYNDIMGRSYDVPIESRKPAASAKKPDMN